MKILYLGDIVGERTLKVLKDNLESIKREYGVQMVLVNAENVSGGKGLTLKHYKELKAMGISGISMGNHTFSKSEIMDYIDNATIVRPANLNTNHGKEILYVKYNNETIAIVNLLGKFIFYFPFVLKLYFTIFIIPYFLLIVNTINFQK